ncbi:MAG: ATP-binding protein [Candidatus Pacebacteria bacterium]|nr:ATP-binding protein [Candidatus Paceibacterota bacterium]
MAYDIFNPQVSKVSRGLEGKTFLIYGTNSVGKTKQATRFPKPFYLAFERGINAISGVPFAPIQKWSDFIQINKQLTNPLKQDDIKNMYNTIIFDTVDAAAIMCQQYVCTKFDAESIASGNKGYGLWSEYATEFWTQINLLTSCGFTVYFIAHQGTREFADAKGETYEKIYPKGDKRSIDPIADLCDVVGFAQENGLDENGKEIKSSLYLVQTKEYFARSRFDYMVPFIKEFTAENLEKALADAVAEEEKHKAGSTVNYEEFKESQETKRLTFEELMEQIGSIAQGISTNEKLNDNEREELANEYIEIVENYLGAGKKVSEANKKQTEQLELILFDLLQNERLSKLK